MIAFLPGGDALITEKPGRLRIVRDGERLGELEEIFVARAWSTSGSHFGGKLAFHPDGTLFVTVGDRGANPLAGHRNQQGLVIDQDSGEVWSTEHGPQGGDELNRILPGRNYGWPVVGYGVQYGGTPIHEARQREGMEEPVQFWTPSIATSGLLLYTGDAFPEWQGQLFVGGLDGQQMARVPIVDGDHGPQVGRMERPPLLYGFGRIRDIRQSPEGYIYLAIDDRRGGGLTPVVRMEPLGRP